MIQCIQYRKSTFLGTPEWLTLPWGQTGKTIYQQLYDKGFVLAALLEDMDNAEPTKENVDISVVSELLGRLSNLVEDLNFWFRDIMQEASSPLYWHVQFTSPSGDPIECIQPCTRQPFAFRTLLIANTIVTYWGLRIILSNTISLTCQHILSVAYKMPSHSSSSIPPQALQGLYNMCLQLQEVHTGNGRLELAMNVVRSMPYCLNENMGLIGAQKSLFAMRVALFALQHHPGDELKWCQAMYQELNSRKGLGYAKEIAKLEGKFGAAGRDKTIRP